VLLPCDVHNQTELNSCTKRTFPMHQTLLTSVQNPCSTQSASLRSKICPLCFHLRANKMSFRTQITTSYSSTLKHFPNLMTCEVSLVRHKLISFIFITQAVFTTHAKWRLNEHLNIYRIHSNVFCTWAFLLPIFMLRLAIAAYWKRSCQSVRPSDYPLHNSQTAQQIRVIFCLTYTWKNL